MDGIEARDERRRKRWREASGDAVSRGQKKTAPLGAAFFDVVEVGGIEPPSEDAPQSGLHA